MSRAIRRSQEYGKYRIQASYTPRRWAAFDGSVDILEHRIGMSLVDDTEHNRDRRSVYSYLLRLAR